ncbi:MAG: hypothetical protein WCQ53_04180 [bacterium]
MNRLLMVMASILGALILTSCSSHSASGLSGLDGLDTSSEKALYFSISDLRTTMYGSDDICTKLKALRATDDLAAQIPGATVIMSELSFKKVIAIDYARDTLDVFMQDKEVLKAKYEAFINDKLGEGTWEEFQAAEDEQAKIDILGPLTAGQMTQFIYPDCDSSLVLMGLSAFINDTFNNLTNYGFNTAVDSTNKILDSKLVQLTADEIAADKEKVSCIVDIKDYLANTAMPQFTTLIENPATTVTQGMDFFAGLKDSEGFACTSKAFPAKADNAATK